RLARGAAGRAHLGLHPRAGIGARRQGRDRRSVALQEERQARGDSVQPVRPRPLRPRRLRGVPRRQAAGLRISGGEDRGGAAGRAEGQGVRRREFLKTGVAGGVLASTPTFVRAQAAKGKVRLAYLQLGWAATEIIHKEDLLGKRGWQAEYSLAPGSSEPRRSSTSAR